MTDRRMDARGKTICLPTLKGGDINNMSPDPEGGRHNKTARLQQGMIRGNRVTGNKKPEQQGIPREEE